MKDARSKVTIVGGGIGGLAAAIALKRAGIEAAVFERAATLQEIGTGLQIWVNGTRALQQLGLADAVQAHGSVIDRFQLRTWRGEMLVDVPTGDLGRQFGIPVVGIARPDLLRTLRSAIGDGVLHLDAECVGFQQDDTGVIVRFADGSEERSLLLVGADGLKSVVRAQQLENVELRYPGYQYVRAVTTFEHEALPPGTSWQFWGRGVRFGLYDVGQGRVNWYAVVYVPAGTTDTDGGPKRELLERYRGWAQPVEAVIEATPESAIQRTDIYDIKPMQRWGEGRVTLLGDAAHAATPGMGRGASEALEDAAVLGDCFAAVGGLKGHDDLVAVLRSYEGRRMEPKATGTSRSWQIGEMGSWKNPVACSVRESFMRRIYSRLVVNALRAELTNGP